MEHEDKIRDRLADLESALQDLAPAPARLDPARTLYLAGQQSMRSHQRWRTFWPLVSACLAVTCMAMGVRLASPVDTKIVYVPVKTAVEESIDNQPARPQEREHVSPPAARDQYPQPNRTELANASQTDSHPSAAAWQALMESRRWQAQVQDDSVNENTTPGEPAAIEVVTSRNWRLMLTDQSPGERFRTLAEPFRQPATPAIQYWTSLIPTRGS